MSMLFCPRCANLLPLHNIDSQLVFSCATCPFQFRVEKKMELVSFGEKKNVGEIEGQTTEGQFDATEKCPKCQNVGVYFEERQTRSADEAATIFYECPKCKEKWQRN